MRELHACSRYSHYQLQIKRFKDLCLHSIRSGNGCVFVSGNDDQIEGFIIGMVDDLYHVLQPKYATDLFFYVSERDQVNAPGLIDAFIDWAWSEPNVVSIRLCATDAVVDYTRTAKLYKRKGFVQEGEMYEMKRISK